MLSQINDLGYLYLACIIAGCLHIDGDILITNLRGELGIINLGVFAPIAPSLEMLKALSHLGLVVKLAVELFALILSSLLPAVQVQAVSEHQKELNHG